MAKDKIWGKALEKARKSDAATGAKSLGTTIKNSELGDDGNKRYLPKLSTPTETPKKTGSRSQWTTVGGGRKSTTDAGKTTPQKIQKFGNSSWNFDYQADPVKVKEVEAAKKGTSIGKTLSGMVKSAGLREAANLTETAGVTMDRMGGTAATDLYQDQLAALDRQIAAAQEQLKRTDLSVADRQDLLDVLRQAQQQRGVYDRSTRANQNTAKSLYGVSDEGLSVAERQDRKNTEGMGAFGQRAVELGTGLMQAGMEGAANLLVPGLGTAARSLSAAGAASGNYRRGADSYDAGKAQRAGALAGAGVLVGDALADAVGAASLNVLKTLGKQNDVLSNILAGGVAGVGGALGETGINELSKAITYDDYEPNWSEIGTNLATGFAFNAINSAVRIAGTTKANREYVQRMNEELQKRYELVQSIMSHGTPDQLRQGAVSVMDGSYQLRQALNELHLVGAKDEIAAINRFLDSIDAEMARYLPDGTPVINVGGGSGSGVLTVSANRGLPSPAAQGDDLVPPKSPGSAALPVDKARAPRYNHNNEQPVSAAAAPAVRQMESQAQVNRAANPENTVLDPATTLFVGQGMSVKKAQEKAAIVQRLVAGEEVGPREINKLNPTSKTSQAIFTQLTGVQFPDTKLSTEQMFNLYRSAHGLSVRAEVRNARQAAEAVAPVSLPIPVAETQTVAPETVTLAMDNADIAVDSAEGRDAFPGLNRLFDGGQTLTQRMAETGFQANPETQDRIAQAQAELADAVNGTQTAAARSGKSSRNEIKLPSGETLTREDFKAVAREKYGQATDSQLDAMFNGLLARTDRGETVPGLEGVALAAKEMQTPASAPTQTTNKSSAPAQRGALTMKEESNGDARRTDILHGGLRGEPGRGAGEQGAGISGGAGGAETPGRGGRERGEAVAPGTQSAARGVGSSAESQEIQYQRRYVRQLRAQKPQTRSLDLPGLHTLKILPNKSLTTGMKRFRSKIERKGGHVQYCLGELSTKSGTRANGLLDPRTQTLYIRADTENQAVSQTSGHEALHFYSWLDGELQSRALQRAVDACPEGWDLNLLDDLIEDVYYDLYKNIIGAFDDQHKDAYYAEFLADLNGGLTGRIRQKLEDVGGKGEIVDALQRVVQSEVWAWEQEWDAAHPATQQNTDQSSTSQDNTEKPSFSLADDDDLPDLEDLVDLADLVDQEELAGLVNQADLAGVPKKFDSWNAAFFYFANDMDSKLAFDGPPGLSPSIEIGKLDDQGNWEETIGVYSNTPGDLAWFNKDLPKLLSAAGGGNVDMNGSGEDAAPEPDKREGFTSTNTKAFKRWFNDPTGELTDPDGRPKVFFRGSPRMGPTTAYDANEANSNGIFFTTDPAVAIMYANGVTNGSSMTLMDWIKSRSTHIIESDKELRYKYFRGWGPAKDYILRNFQAQGDGLRLVGVTADGKETDKLADTDHFSLQTNAATERQLRNEGRYLSDDWRELASFPKTKQGLEDFNHQLGDIIRDTRLGVRGYGKYYLTSERTLVVDADGDDYHHISNDHLLPAVQGKFGDTHIDRLVKKAFNNGYDAVVVKNVDDNGGLQDQYVVKTSNQVKSVYNKSTWDKNDRDFLFSLSPDEGDSSGLTSATDPADQTEKPQEFNTWGAAYMYLENTPDLDLAFDSPPGFGDQMELGVLDSHGKWVQTLGTYPNTAEGLKQFNADLPGFLSVYQASGEELEQMFPPQAGDLDSGYWYEGDGYGYNYGDYEPDVPDVDEYSSDSSGLPISHEAVRVQNDREGFTRTDTPAFKRWFKDPSGEFTNPDGRPKVFLRGSAVMGATTARDADEAKSKAIFFTVEPSIAQIYAADRSEGTLMDAIKGGKNGITEELKRKYFRGWGPAKDYILRNFQSQGAGLRLMGLTADGEETNKLADTDHFSLQTNATTRAQFEAGGGATTENWRELATFPKTKQGLEDFNHQLGELIRKNDLGIRGYGKYYLSSENPLVLDLQGAHFDDVPNETLPAALRSPGKPYAHVNGIVARAFANGYDAVILKDMGDTGGKHQTQYAIKTSNQMKSVYNKGTWDEDNRDFLFSLATDAIDAVQNERDGFTDTDTPAFKDWFKDPAGEFSNPDGQPKVFLHGDRHMGFTTAYDYDVAHSKGIFFTADPNVAGKYSGVSIPGYPETLMDGIKGRENKGSEELKRKYFRGWGPAKDYILRNFQAQGDGLRLVGVTAAGKETDKLTDTDHFSLQTNAATEKEFNTQGWYASNVWRELASFPKTKQGLEDFNHQLGELIRKNDLGVRGHGKYYLSGEHPLVIDAGGDPWMGIENSRLPQFAQGKYGGRNVIDDVAYAAFENGYDAVIVKNVNDLGGLQTQYIVKRSNQVKSVYNKGTWDKNDRDFLFSLSPNEKQRKELENFFQNLESEYGEGSADAMFETFEQLDRARRRAEERAADAEAAQQAAEWATDAAVEAARIAEQVKADKRLQKQRDAFQEKTRQKAAKARLEKANAVKSARLAEQMHTGRQWAERLRKHDEKAEAKQAAMKQAAQERLDQLRAQKDQEISDVRQAGQDRLDRLREQKNQKIEDTRLAERMNAGKQVSAAKRKAEEKLAREKAKRIQDHKLASKDAKTAASVLRKYHNTDTDKLTNAPVATLREAYHKPTPRDTVKKAADKLRTAHREFYKAFINGTQAIDDFSKYQKVDANTSVLLRTAMASNSTSQSILKDHLVGKDGSVIDDRSLEDVVICWDGSGKHRKYNDDKQRVLQDYMLHRHNIDRMSFRDKALEAVEAYEQTYPWLTTLGPREFAELVADDNRVAQRYQELIENFQRAKNKPIFQDENGSPLTADYSRSMVQQYEQQYDWVKEKAEDIYDWWDKFMQEWVVGETISADEYATLRETYPSYVPTYRKDKAGLGNGVSAFGGTVTAKRTVRKATGGTSPVANIEDSFVDLMMKNVKSQRTNMVLRSITDTAMTDEDGDFNGFAIFDWDDAPEVLRWGLAAEGIEGALEAGTDKAAANALSKDGDVCKIRAWANGERVSAYVDPELYKALEFAFNQETGWFTKVGQKLTSPMKTFITGINPGFALRNVIRDNLTAQMNSVSVVNSISGAAFEKYYARAWKEMVSGSENWQHFEALGGTNAGYYNNEGGGYINSLRHQKMQDMNPLNMAGKALGFVGERTESVTRFAEYLATIDRLPGGDTYGNRLVGIKNAAEVTVDFSRKGTLGKAFNAWIPYWNPAVQGIDKVVRSFFDAPGVADKAKVLSRAALTTLPLDLILFAVYKYLGRDDEWEELSDRTKDAYYCIPLADEHKFLKIPKSRDWGQIIGVPLMRMLQGQDGREDSFENYFEVAISPNFMWSNPLDAIGLSTIHDLAKNEDFAGRAIVPSNYAKMAKGDQWDADTSKLSKGVSDIVNALSQKFVGEDWLSPMQLDYIISDYFGDFGDMFIRMNSIGGTDKSLSAGERASEVAEDLFGNWVADNRYSSASVSDYYDLLDKISQELAAERVRNPDGYQNTPLYKLNSALNDQENGPSTRISKLNAEVRNLPDGEKKDAIKEQIVEIAREALEMYDAVQSGELQEPKMEMQYSKYGEKVSKELIALKDYAGDYSFFPSNYKPKSYTDPRDSKREYVLDEAAQEKYRELYDEEYQSVMEDAMKSSKYKNASSEKRAELLEAARDDVAPQVKSEFLKWLRKNYKSTPKK